MGTINLEAIMAELFDGQFDIMEAQSTSVHVMYLLELQDDKFATVDFEYKTCRDYCGNTVIVPNAIATCDIEYYDNKYATRQERYTEANAEYWGRINYYLNKER